MATALVAIAVLAALPSAARANTIPVTGTGDGIASDGHCSVREAIQAANTNAAVNECPAGSGADAVTVPAGTYTLTIPISFFANDDNMSGDLNVLGDLTITGAGAGVTVIDADRKDRVLTVKSGVVSLNGLTITGGLTQYDPAASATMVPPGPDGGGIRNIATLTLTDCEVTDNATGNGANGHSIGTANGAQGGNGGGISSFSSGTLTLRRTTVSRNRTGRGGNGSSVAATFVGGPGTGGSGGAGGDGGGVATIGPVTIDQSVIASNVTGAGGTGGAAVGSTGSNTPSGGVAGTGGSATAGPGGAGGRGGGVASTPPFGTPTATITDTFIAGNSTASGGTGGNATGGTGGHASTGTVAGGQGGDATAGAGGDGGQGGGLFTDFPTVNGSGDTFSDNRTGDGGRGGSGTAGGGAAATATSGSANGGKGGQGTGGKGGRGGAGGGVGSSAGVLTFSNTTWSSNATGSGGGGGAAVGGGGGTGLGASGSGGAGGDAVGSFGGDGGPGGAAAFLTSTPSLTHVTIADDSAGPGGVPGGADDGPGGVNGSGGNAAAGQSSVGSLGTGNTFPGVAAIGGSGTISNSVMSEAAPGCSGLTDSGHNMTSAVTCPGTVGDPKLGPRADNGGPTPTRALKPGSAALDAVPASGAGCSAADQRGVGRPRGVACDAGAYEVAAPDVATGAASGVGQRAATVAGTVNPNGRPTLYFFEIHAGTSPVTRSPAAVTGRGIAPATVRATFSALKPATTYRYRLVATSAEGTTTGVEHSFTTKPLPPVFLSAKIFPATFAVDPKGSAETPVSGARAPKGTTFTYKLSAAARVVFKIELLPKGKPAKLIGRFAQQAHAGKNTKRFSGRIGKKSLKPGSYRATLVATDAAHQSSKPKRLTFKVVSG